MERALVIMARYPEVGRVKTRLAARCGAEKACALYRAFLLDLRDRMTAAPHATVWAYTPDDAAFETVVGAASNLVRQGEGTLAERMARVFTRLLDPAAHRAYERVAMIGGDVPHVPAEWIERAFALLDDADIVIGPADDGGYYLVALRQPHDIFRGVPMGTAAVYAATLARVAELGLRVATLPPLFDLDLEEDLERLRGYVETHPSVCLNHTMAELDKLEATQWKSF